jgi:hypothetical protein
MRVRVNIEHPVARDTCGVSAFRLTLARGMFRNKLLFDYGDVAGQPVRVAEDAIWEIVVLSQTGRHH